MKKMIFAALACVAMLASAMPAGAETKMVRLSKFEGKKITGLEISNHFKVDVQQSDRAVAVVEIPAELEGRLTFELRDGILRLAMDMSGLNSNGNRNQNRHYHELIQNIRATIKVGSLNSVAASSLDIKLDSHCNMTNINVDTPRLKVENSSHSQIRHIVHNGEESEVRLNSHSSIIIWGNVNVARLDVESHCQYNGFDYFTKELHVDVESHSGADVAVSENLYADINSYSHLNYRGEPVLQHLNITSHSFINKR